MRRFALIAVVVGFALILAARDVSPAADEPAADALKPGSAVPATIRPWMLTGKHLRTLRNRVRATGRPTDSDDLKKDKEAEALSIRGVFHCPVTEQGLNPVVLIFVKGVNPGPALLNMLGKVDEKLAKHERDRLAGFAIFLDPKLMDTVTEDDARNKLTADLEPKLNPQLFLAAGVDSFDKVKAAFKLNPDVDITVVTYDRLRVAAVRTLLDQDLGEKAEAEILKDIDAALAASKKPTVPAPPPAPK